MRRGAVFPDVAIYVSALVHVAKYQYREVVAHLAYDVI